MPDEILDVDLLAFETGPDRTRRAVVDGAMRSLQVGFVYTSHDLGDGLLDDVYALLNTFFALSAADKERFRAPGTHGQTGYTSLGVETAASAAVPDWKEMLNWGTTVPAGHPLGERYPHRYPAQLLPEEVVPGISELLWRFHHLVADLQRRFLRVIAVGLGCAEDLFDTMVAAGPTLSRALHYPAMDLAPDRSAVWAAEHGDINLITALPRATAPGLQVRVDDRWVDVTPPPGRAVINTGIMLERLTNGLVPVGRHRVIAPPGEGAERLSVVQFCHPTPWTVLAPLAACVGPDRPQRFGAIEAGDLLDEVLWEINLTEGGGRLAKGGGPE